MSLHMHEKLLFAVPNHLRSQIVESGDGFVEFLHEDRPIRLRIASHGDTSTIMGSIAWQDVSVEQEGALVLLATYLNCQATRLSAFPFWFGIDLENKMIFAYFAIGGEHATSDLIVETLLRTLDVSKRLVIEGQ
ncbi:hypothetical protein [Noviherbaspirillum galbum]|uniref:Uncharacterized protein n=1 Tax=Noviherbaspirillum galbum TaxID=2709383 RepID=A0A6B3STG7_9BURK|nr:hypothetical protein [Noviherbaspirillum galbum]NEX60919.1 hypothetical protein [Noviherbaspirillum galbum]